jgi:hypothetical protein
MPMPRKPRAQCLNCGKEVAQPGYKFCTNTCQLEHQYQAYITRWKNGLESGNISHGRNTQISWHVRRYLKAKYGTRCTRCGWSERNPYTGRVPITIEHIDGNPYNSSEQNLTLLCPNCHSLTATYGYLNRGNGRHRRYVDNNMG